MWNSFGFFPSVLRTALMCLPMQLSFRWNFSFSCASSKKNIASRTRILPAHSTDITCLCYGKEMDCCRDIRAPWSPDTNKMRSKKKLMGEDRWEPSITQKSAFLLFNIASSPRVLLLCMERYWTSIVEIALDFFGRSVLLLWYGWCPQKWIKQMDFNNIWLNVPFCAGWGRTASSYSAETRPAITI